MKTGCNTLVSFLAVRTSNPTQIKWSKRNGKIDIDVNYSMYERRDSSVGMAGRYLASHLNSVGVQSE
jgi:hypothetical protein